LLWDLLPPPESLDRENVFDIELLAERLVTVTRWVRAPTLLIVGGADTQVLRFNRQAADAMSCEHRVEVVPGATHLFEEPGALEAAAEVARDWFVRHLGAART
ncbi:MAG: phosphoribosyltransferase, partial [Acidimicrobiia bacterium]